MVGRIPVIGALHELKESALVDILTKPKNAIIKQYQKLFEMEDVQLEFSTEALEEIAKIAIKRGSGARGLRAIMEKFMLNVMYHLPEMVNLKECMISRDTVLENSDPIFTYKKGTSHQSA